MLGADPAVDLVDVFRRRAWQAEAEAAKADDSLAQEVFILVAMTWREIAADAARMRRNAASDDSVGLEAD